MHETLFKYYIQNDIMLDFIQWGFKVVYRYKISVHGLGR